MTDKDKEFLDSLDDKTFMIYMVSNYLTRMPVWKRCSQKEYEKYCGKADDERITTEDLVRFTENMFNGREYRAVPIYKNGGGILDHIQIPGKKPDGYVYERLDGYKEVLLLGGEMIDYCMHRECMKRYFKNIQQI